ncbi:GntR family transcriptional regulator [Desulfobacula phenolica]|uniref:GntR family transcriptional regulator n=1 Tax=Desulfobacula phenolica TaxID=90732 RepID=A0A1H2JHX4_9BACT|nr:GntR family transcriptional regulator [Desulfobacula phenolica]SDU55738.1 GntR family transcriptional regulator [Desulfobacula phenolica]
MLNHKSPLPLYHQLADILTEQIRCGTYMPGDLIPSENGMAKQYGIGRPTVRQAMDTLVKKGLVERKRGSGTFVKQPGNQVDLFCLAGTSQAFETKGIKTESKLLAPLAAVNVTDDKTNPFEGKPAFFLSRLTCVKADPVLLEDIYLHPVLFRGLETVDLENRSLSGVVSDQYYLKPETGRQTFKISFLPENKSTALNLNPSDPVLEVERTLNFPEAPGAIFSRLYCRTDKFAFSQTMSLKMT